MATVEMLDLYCTNGSSPPVATKVCSLCRVEKSLDDFDKKTKSKDGRQPRCHDCNCGHTDPSNFVYYKYVRYMLQRVNGTRNRHYKNNTWIGKPIMPRDEFIEWSLNQPAFWNLWDAWQEAGRPRALCPTIDRMSNDDGYVLDNIRWVSLSDNVKAKNHG